MNAKQKREAVEKAIQQMTEINDLKELHRTYNAGYEAARGSNDRKEQLENAFREAQLRIKGKVR
jgi:hypothetical protein